MEKKGGIIQESIRDLSQVNRGFPVEVKGGEHTIFISFLNFLNWFRADINITGVEVLEGEALGSVMQLLNSTLSNLVVRSAVL